MEHKVLIDLGACAGARAWASDYPTLRDAWIACDRGDWMLWLVAYTLPRERLVWVTCQIARTALVYVPAGEDRPRLEIETAEAWARGETSLEEVSYASYSNAYDIAVAEDTAEAYVAADSAASAAEDAAYEAAYDATGSVAAAEDAAEAAGFQSGRIIRREIAWEEIEAALPA